MKKTVIFIIMTCLAISLTGCINIVKDSAVEKVYTGELLSVIKENETDIVRIKLVDGTEMDFTFIETTINGSPTRNFIPGQQLEIKCQEYKDSDYRPILSIKIS